MRVIDCGAAVTHRLVQIGLVWIGMGKSVHRQELSVQEGHMADLGRTAVLGLPVVQPAPALADFLTSEFSDLGDGPLTLGGQCARIPRRAAACASEGPGSAQSPHQV